MGRALTHTDGMNGDGGGGAGTRSSPCLANGCSCSAIQHSCNASVLDNLPSICLCEAYQRLTKQRKSVVTTWRSGRAARQIPVP